MKSCGRYDRTASQIGCGFSSSAQDPKAMRVRGGVCACERAGARVRTARIATRPRTSIDVSPPS
jgi:hypothetical protein